MHYLLSITRLVARVKPMLKQAVLWLLSVLSFTVSASNVTNISQQTWLKTDKSQFVLIDVRTAKEYAEGHVPNALNIPLASIVDNPNILKDSKGENIVLYCRSGYRAGKAAEVLLANGYSNLHHLEGDMLGWLQAKHPVEK